MAYPLSAGPAYYCEGRGWVPPGTFNGFYSPLSERFGGVDDWWWGYVWWWATLAGRHRDVVSD